MSKKDKKPEAAQAQTEAQEPVQAQPEEAPEVGAPQESPRLPRPNRPLRPPWRTRWSP